jgi:NADH-quinone oxidoreductase subunit G
LIENLSTARSPQQMLGSLVKTHFAKKLAVPKENICLVSIMPCTAKKHESRRPEFSGDVDYVLTTREFGHLLRSRRIPVHSLASSEFDEPLGMSTGAGALFGVTGGVMEAAVRTAQVLSGLDQKDILALNSLEQVRGLEGVKSCSVLLQKSDGSHTRLNIAVVNGTGNTRHLLENREVSFDFIEVMACPGGCIGGGGQPKSKDPDILSKRMNAIYRTDQASKIRKSHENPAIHEIYKNFLDSPLSDKSHELLHTTYTNLKSKSKSTK